MPEQGRTVSTADVGCACVCVFFFVVVAVARGVGVGSLPRAFVLAEYVRSK